MTVSEMKQKITEHLDLVGEVVSMEKKGDFLFVHGKEKGFKFSIKSPSVFNMIMKKVIDADFSLTAQEPVAKGKEPELVEEITSKPKK